MSYHSTQARSIMRHVGEYRNAKTLADWYEKGVASSNTLSIEDRQFLVSVFTREAKMLKRTGFTEHAYDLEASMRQIQDRQ